MVCVTVLHSVQSFRHLVITKPENVCLVSKLGNKVSLLLKPTFVKDGKRNDNSSANLWVLGSPCWVGQHVRVPSALPEAAVPLQQSVPWLQGAEVL